MITTCCIGLGLGDSLGVLLGELLEALPADSARRLTGGPAGELPPLLQATTSKTTDKKATAWTLEVRIY
jgi:hypothetical protein